MKTLYKLCVSESKALKKDRVSLLNCDKAMHVNAVSQTVSGLLILHTQNKLLDAGLDG